MATPIPPATETTNPTRSPNDPLVSFKQGDATDAPKEFQSSVVITTVEQTGISTTEPMAPANDSTLWQSELQQTKTREKTLVQKIADYSGLHLIQRESDPVSGVPVEIDKSIVPTIGGVYLVQISNGGSAYTAATVVTGTTPFGGSAAQYGPPVIIGGVIQSVEVIDPGSAFTVNDTLVFTDLAGSGAAGVGLIPNYPSTGSGISGFTSIVAGSGYTGATTATVPAPAQGRRAILTPIISTGHITGFTIVDPGLGYETVPTLTIADTGGGTGGSAVVVLGVDTWFDYTPLNKWKSIQFASRCPDAQSDLDLLKVIIPGNMSFPWPPTLQSVTVYREDGSHVEVATGTFSSVTIGGGFQFDGAVAAPLKEGLRNPVASSLTRTFWKGYPNITDTCTKIQLSTGMVIVQGGANSVFNTYSASNIAAGTSTDTSLSTKFTVVSIPPCLTNGVTLVYGGAGSQATGTLVLPASTPTVFSSGDVVIADISVTQWRFGIYVMEVKRVTYP